MLLALINVVLVLASRGRLEPISINKVEPEKTIVLLSQVYIAVGAHLLEMGEAEDGVVDLDRFARDDVGHVYLDMWGTKAKGKRNQIGKDEMSHSRVSDLI